MIDFLNRYIDAFMEFRADLGEAFIETAQMMLAAALLTFFVGLLYGFLMFLVRDDGIYENKIIYTIMSTIVNVIRSIPFILFIIVMIPVSRAIMGTGFGVKASILPLSLIGIATFARFIERDLLDVDRNIYETSYALGANKWQYCKDFLFLEARSAIVLSYASTIISLLAYSTVMGVIGGGGLGYLAMSEGYYNFNYPLMWIVIIIMIIIVQVVQAVANVVARRLDRR